MIYIKSKIVIWVFVIFLFGVIQVFVGFSKSELKVLKEYFYFGYDIIIMIDKVKQGMFLNVQ